MPPKPSTSPRYTGERYIRFDDLVACCEALAQDAPDWVALETVGHSRHDRPILLLTIGARSADVPGDPDHRPGFWLDGGTHAVEWTGVSSALASAAQWVAGLMAGDETLTEWFRRHTAYVMPCISPDGYVEAMEVGAFLRSSLRTLDGPRSGFEAKDLDGDGVVRWMRWRHPAGPFAIDPDVPAFMRPRTVDDDPADAYFVCTEGEFVEWDGHRWISAPARYGIDLNRNFPAHWQPFGMFGMDGGAYPLSEPETRAVVDAFAARPYIAAAVTNHTYTGCILTQPYRGESPLDTGDIELMEHLAHQAVEGTGYRVFRIHPEFTYDPKKAVVGVWSDTMSTTFGVPGYTLELWDPYGFCGLKNDKPAEFFRRPDPAVIRDMLQRMSEEPGGFQDWAAFEHPQLGAVEIGGIDYLRTVRNPPEPHLEAECGRGHRVADAIRRALPNVDVQLGCYQEPGGLTRVEAIFENTGFLSTAGLKRAEGISGVPRVSVTLEPGDGVERVDGEREQVLHHLDGWGAPPGFGGNHPLYPGLPGRGHRAVARWWVRGEGTLTVAYTAGRGGRGRVEVEL